MLTIVLHHSGLAFVFPAQSRVADPDASCYPLCEVHAAGCWHNYTM